MSSVQTIPTPEEIDDLLLSARFGELEEVQSWQEKFGSEALVAARDERGNSVLHMCAANGHVDIIQYILALTISPALIRNVLTSTNEAGTPPLHWAIVNKHLEAVKKMVEVDKAKGGGVDLLQQRNASKRTALLEAYFHGEGREEIAGWIEGYMDKTLGVPEEEEQAERSMKTGATEEQVEEKDVQGSETVEEAQHEEVNDVTKQTGDMGL